MFSFLFASLFSWIFWVMYFGIGLFVGVILTRINAPKTYRHAFKGWDEDKIFRVYKTSLMSEEVFFILLVNFLFWPITLFISIFVYFFRFVFENLLAPGIKNFIFKIDSIIPDIEIKTIRKEMNK